MSLCKREHCEQLAIKHFCEDHLKHPPVENIKFSENIEASPTNFNIKFNKNSESALNNSMASAILSMNPLKMKKTRPYKKKIRQQMENTFKHNEKHLKQIFIKKTDMSDMTSKHFAPSDELIDKGAADIWCTTDKFLEFAQLKDQHQLVQDEESGQLLFFIPSKNHQNEILTEKLQRKFMIGLKLSVELRNNQINKNARVRQTHASKWIWTGK